MQIKFIFKVIKGFSKKDLKDLNELMLQWSKKRRKISPEYFKKLIKKSHILTLSDGSRIIGTVTLVEINKLSGLKGSIEHLIIDEKYRGRGLGERLMKYAISHARKLEIETLFLTAEPDRLIANNLYKKMGFKIKKTNFYQLKLK
ncbi:MAG: GNAT family N-acetyltransferase [Patescibacteria group bacterium]